MVSAYKNALLVQIRNALARCASEYTIRKYKDNKFTSESFKEYIFINIFKL